MPCLVAVPGRPALLGRKTGGVENWGWDWKKMRRGRCGWGISMRINLKKFKSIWGKEREGEICVIVL